MSVGTRLVVHIAEMVTCISPKPRRDAAATTITQHNASILFLETLFFIFKTSMQLVHGADRSDRLSLSCFFVVQRR